MNWHIIVVTLIFIGCTIAQGHRVRIEHRSNMLVLREVIWLCCFAVDTVGLAVLAVIYRDDKTSAAVGLAITAIAYTFITTGALKVLMSISQVLHVPKLTPFFRRPILPKSKDVRRF